MKIAISTSTDTIDGPSDPRFGRAAYYCLVDPETEEWEAFDNSAVHAIGGAGVQAAQFVVEQGAGAAISGGFGPNAFAVLSAAGVQMFLAPAGETLTGRELLARYQKGQLESPEAPTAPGRHGRR